jgi:MFS family permease
LIDKSNRVFVLATCVLIWSLATAGGGLATSFLFLFIARTGVGAGEAAVSPAAVSLLGDYFPPNKVQQPLSVYTVGLYAGGGLALILGAEAVAYLTTLGPVALPYIGAVSAWRMTFLFLGLPGVIVAALLFFTVRNPPRRIEAAIDGQVQLGAIAFARANRRLLTLIVTAVVVWGMNGYGFLNWYPAMLMRTFGMTPHVLARTYGVAFLVCGTLGSLALGPLSQALIRRGRSDAVFVVSTIALSLLALSSTIGPLMPDRIGVIACASVSLFCQALVVASVYGIIAAVAPGPLRGSYTGFYMVIMNITGGAFGAVLVGILNDHVFGALAINRSLALVGFVFGPVAALLMWLAAREFRTVVIQRSRSTST